MDLQNKEKQYKLLVVDDIEMNRAMLMKIFSEDYLLFQAEDGVQALEILNQEDINIILLDLIMPVMDGYDVIRAMKSDKRLASIPIVVTTGVVGKAERLAFELGADDFVAKPFDPYIVRKRVENLIQKYILQMENFRQELNREKEISRVKTDFLARMSHDLRTPMNAIIGLTVLTMDDAEYPEIVRENMAKMRSAGDFMLGMVNDILEMANLEENSIALRKEPYSYREFLDTLTTMFQPECRQKQITFTVEEPQEDWIVLVDHTRLTQMFVHIISNAVKFTPSGGHIEYFTENRKIGPNEISADYIVRDDGIGMTPEFQKKMFAPFTRENAEVTPELQGSGLGLSITRQLVERMNGTLEIISEKGHGTTVRVHLTVPYLKENQIVEIEPFSGTTDWSSVYAKRRNSLRAQEYANLSGKTVLLVEDHPMNTLIASQLLEKQNMSVIHAENGMEAVEQFRAAPEGTFDAILMDIQMPVMNGYAATENIRALPRMDAETIPIIAMTANSYPEDVKKSRKAGMNVHLSKPIEPKLLYQALMKFLVVLLSVGVSIGFLGRVGEAGSCVFAAEEVTEMTLDTNSIPMTLFYENSCASCDPTEEFYTIFHEKLDDIKSDYTYEIKEYNTFHTDAKERYRSVCQEYQIQEASLPMLIIGDQVLCGYEAIEAGIQEAFLRAGSREISTDSKRGNTEETIETEKEKTEVKTGDFSQTKAQDCLEWLQTAPGKDSVFFLFSTFSCSQCENVKEMLKSLKSDAIQVWEGSVTEEENLALVQTFFERWEVPQEEQQVPILFYEGGFLSGEAQIREGLSEVLSSGSAVSTKRLTAAVEAAAEGNTGGQGIGTLERMSIGEWIRLAVTGLLNGLNPCGASMLFLMLSVMAASGHSLGKTGGAYLTGKYLAYLLMGFGFYHIIMAVGQTVFTTLSQVLTWIFACMAVLLAVMYLIDFIHVRRQEYGKIRMQLPAGVRRFNHSMIKKAEKIPAKWLLPGIFVLGIVISIGEFFCTGQIYLASILYLVKRGDQGSIAAFLIYVTAMCIPSIILTVVIARTSSILGASEFALKHMGIVKLLYALLFLGFAVALLFF